MCIFYRWSALCHSTTGSIITSIFDVTVQNNTWCDITCVHKNFHSVDYLSDESSSGTSGNAGGGESDSDSSYCPTSDSCECETVVKEGPVLGSIVIHPLVLQFIEPVTSLVVKSHLKLSSQLALHCGTTLLLFLIGLVL